MDQERSFRLYIYVVYTTHTQFQKISTVFFQENKNTLVFGFSKNK